MLKIRAVAGKTNINCLPPVRMHVTYFKSRTGIVDLELLEFTLQSVITVRLRKMTLSLPRSRIMDIIVYLIGWLRKLLWNSYLLNELLSQRLYVLRTATFPKKLYAFSQVLLFQRIRFFRTDSF